MKNRNDILMTLPEVLELLNGVSRRTFYRWRARGKAPACVQYPNDELRVWRSDLDAWLDGLREAS